MGQKSDPRGLRTGVNKNWHSRWYNNKNYKKILQQDVMINEYIKTKFKHAAISNVEIEMSVAKIRIIMYTNRLGVLI